MLRRRLAPDDARAAAVEAAHGLLIEDGASAITLKAVAQRVGRTHANLLHHFGSAAGLHRALAEEIARRVSASITAAIASRRRGEATPRDVVDAMFDAFARDRVGELVGWIALTRQREALLPVTETVAAILADFRAAGDPRPMDRVVLGLVLLAIGDSLVGAEVAAATGDDPMAVREIAVAQIGALLS
ncbi:TetR family transcriptional regulator [Sphingomonas sp.]|uniref:TetR/AcrR family transcriptional regulator n=1 Tax=Sphingomonas sp. TaxID=28214 RepID=UPI00325FA4B7